MKTLLAILIFVLVGFGIVGLIHGSLYIVLTNFTEVKSDALLRLVVDLREDQANDLCVHDAG